MNSEVDDRPPMPDSGIWVWDKKLNEWVESPSF